MGNKGGGLGTTLVLALVIVILSVALGVGLARYGLLLPIVGPLLGEKPPRTTTGPVVVEGIQELDQLATVRLTESVPVTRETGGDVLDRLFNGERVLVIATGEVEAGVDLGDIGKDDVKLNSGTVTIDLPEPQILSASLDEQKIRVYDRDFSPLNVRPYDTYYCITTGFWNPLLDRTRFFERVERLIRHSVPGTDSRLRSEREETLDG
jgi:hypothetical protein